MERTPSYSFKRIFVIKKMTLFLLYERKFGNQGILLHKRHLNGDYAPTRIKRTLLHFPPLVPNKL